jgi:hypothetical protein
VRPHVSTHDDGSGGAALATEFAEEPLELFHALASLQFRGSDSYAGDLEEWPGAKHVLLTAFGQLGRGASLGCLDQLSASGASPTTPQCMAAIKLVRFFDEPEDAFLLARFVDRAEAELHPRVDEELVRLFAESFSRSSGTREMLLDDWLRWSESTATILVRASAAAGRPEANEDLVFLLGSRGDLDPTLLYTLCAASDELPRWAHEWTAEFVARSLWEDESHLLRAVTTATQHFPSEEITRPLVSLLSHADPGVRTGAHRALGAHTGLRFPESTRMWQDWLRDQDHWFDEVAPLELSHLESRDRGEVLRSIRKLSLHRLHRAELSEELVVTLLHEDPLVRRAGCDALATMNAWDAVEDLVSTLNDDDADVRAAAHRALARITGLSLPRDPQPWEHWLEEQESVTGRFGRG